MTLHLKAEIAAGLEALATAHGLSVEDYLKQLVERELSSNGPEIAPHPRLSAEMGTPVRRMGGQFPRSSSYSRRSAKP